MSVLSERWRGKKAFDQLKINIDNAIAGNLLQSFSEHLLREIANGRYYSSKKWDTIADCCAFHQEIHKVVFLPRHTNILEQLRSSRSKEANRRKHYYEKVLKAMFCHINVC